MRFNYQIQYTVIGILVHCVYIITCGYHQIKEQLFLKDIQIKYVRSKEQIEKQHSKIYIFDITRCVGGIVY